MNVCIAGKNEIAINTAKLIAQEFPYLNLLACINKTDDGIDTWQPSFKRYCTINNIKIFQLREIYSLKNLLFLSLEYDRILQPALFLPPHLLINIHFSKLPAYKGMFTSVLPLLNGEIESGVTLHEIDRGIDTGNIIDQFVFSLPINMTAKELYSKYMYCGFELIKKNISNLIFKNYESYRQPLEKSTYYSKTSIDFNDINISLNMTAFQVHNQIRAFIFRDYQLPVVAGNKIYKSEMIWESTQGRSGTIAKQDEFAVELNTIDYKVRLYKDKSDELFAFARAGNIVNLQRLENSGFPISIRSKEGWDVFIVGCYYNQIEFVKYCIEKGWDVNTTNYKGTTATMYAMTALIEGRGQETFRLIMEYADLTLKDHMGRDIQYYARHYGNIEVIKLIESKRYK